MRKLWNDGWSFMKCPVDMSFTQAMKLKDEMKPVEIPHDWLIYDSNNLYEDSTGWYTKTFNWSEQDGDMLLTFEGVYMNSTIYVNQKEAGEWKYGYSSFTLNVTDYLEDGQNEIVVLVRHQSPNSRWYSGAGIYRNVWVRLEKDIYIEENGIYVHTEEREADAFELTVETNVVLERFLAEHAAKVLGTMATGDTVGEVKSRMMSECICAIDHILVDMETGMRMPLFSVNTYEKEPVLGQIGGCSATGALTDEIRTYGQKFLVEAPIRWDVENPYRYELITRLYRGVKEEGQDEINLLLCGTQSTIIGFKTFEINKDKGFFLNGRHMKLNGVCEHHDLGALGSAFNKEAQRRKYQLLKDMGVNAIRFSHNMPAPGCLELCDEMGLLVMDESYDMWEKPKTEYDFARFFNDWVERDMESYVRRDRNHPSLILWSVGNEIYDTHADAERGKEIITMLKALVNKYDPLGNAPVTFASNYLPWENTQHSAKVMDAVGYNYSERYYEEHHKTYPERVIFGSETASIVYSRGIYHFPFSANILAEDDEQCSALGNSVTSWGAKSFEALVTEDRDMEFSLGQFLWTGTDYIGEPTPYHTKNSYFGQIDTAGFPKDAYYVIQSAWTDYKKKPMIHIFPYWDFNEGQLIDVRVCSNAPYVELFINEKSLGKQQLTHLPKEGNHVIADYQIPYEKGVLKALAYDEEGKVICEEEKYSFGDAQKLVLRANKPFLENDEDIQFITITAVDQDGHIVENATNRVNIEVSGAGRLVGLDNGDSTDFDSYKGNSKRMFSGKLLAMIKPSGEDGPISIKASFDENDVPVRKIEITPSVEFDKDGTFASTRVITPASGLVKAKAKILPENTSYKDVVWRAVNETGVVVNQVMLLGADGNVQDGKEIEGDSVIIKPLGDGAFRLRCMARSGDTERYRIISDLEMCVEGFGPAFLNPYELIAGSLYSRANGKQGAGNEKGVASASDGETVITFDNIDFGAIGSDRITMPIFALNSEPYEIEIYEGTPEEGDLVSKVLYQKPSIWNTYQEESWIISRKFKGITTISFKLFSKIHIKGFVFDKEEKAYAKLQALEADAIYGDSFTKTEDAVEEIGNNVSILYNSMNFGEKGCSKITIMGRACKASNTIHLRFARGDEEIKQIIEFPQSDSYKEVTFDIEKVEGEWDLSFVFMPGSNFDFKWLQFV